VVPSGAARALLIVNDREPDAVRRALVDFAVRGNQEHQPAHPQQPPAGRSVLVAEKGLQVAATMYDAKDKHVLVFDAVNDDIPPHRHAAASGAEIVIAGTSDIGEARQHEEAVGEGVN